MISSSASAATAATSLALLLLLVCGIGNNGADARVYPDFKGLPLGTTTTDIVGCAYEYFLAGVSIIDENQYLQVNTTVTKGSAVVTAVASTSFFPYDSEFGIPYTQQCTTTTFGTRACSLSMVCDSIALNDLNYWLLLKTPANTQLSTVQLSLGAVPINFLTIDYQTPLTVTASNPNYVFFKLSNNNVPTDHAWSQIEFTAANIQNGQIAQLYLNHNSRAGELCTLATVAPCIGGTQACKFKFDFCGIPFDSNWYATLSFAGSAPANVNFTISYTLIAREFENAFVVTQFPFFSDIPMSLGPDTTNVYYIPQLPEISESSTVTQSIIFRLTDVIRGQLTMQLSANQVDPRCSSGSVLSCTATHECTIELSPCTYSGSLASKYYLFVSNNDKNLNSGPVSYNIAMFHRVEKIGQLTINTPLSDRLIPHTRNPYYLNISSISNTSEIEFNIYLRSGVPNDQITLTVLNPTLTYDSCAADFVQPAGPNPSPYTAGQSLFTCSATGGTSCNFVVPACLVMNGTWTVVITGFNPTYNHTQDLMYTIDASIRTATVIPNTQEQTLVAGTTRANISSHYSYTVPTMSDCSVSSTSCTHAQTLSVSLVATQGSAAKGTVYLYINYNDLAGCTTCYRNFMFVVQTTGDETKAVLDVPPCLIVPGGTYYFAVVSSTDAIAYTLRVSSHLLAATALTNTVPFTDSIAIDQKAHAYTFAPKMPKNVANPVLKITMLANPRGQTLDAAGYLSLCLFHNITVPDQNWLEQQNNNNNNQNSGYNRPFTCFATECKAVANEPTSCIFESPLCMTDLPSTYRAVVAVMPGPSSDNLLSVEYSLNFTIATPPPMNTLPIGGVIARQLPVPFQKTKAEISAFAIDNFEIVSGLPINHATSNVVIELYMDNVPGVQGLTLYLNQDGPAGPGETGCRSSTASCSVNPKASKCSLTLTPCDLVKNFRNYISVVPEPNGSVPGVIARYTLSATAFQPVGLTDGVSYGRNWPQHSTLAHYVFNLQSSSGGLNPITRSSAALVDIELRVIDKQLTGNLYVNYGDITSSPFPLAGCSSCLSHTRYAQSEPSTQAGVASIALITIPPCELALLPANANIYIAVSANLVADPTSFGYELTVTVRDAKPLAAHWNTVLSGSTNALGYQVYTLPSIQKYTTGDISVFIHGTNPNSVVPSPYVLYLFPTDPTISGYLHASCYSAYSTNKTEGIINALGTNVADWTLAIKGLYSEINYQVRVNSNNAMQILTNVVEPFSIPALEKNVYVHNSQTVNIGETLLVTITITKPDNVKGVNLVVNAGFPVSTDSAIDASFYQISLLQPCTTSQPCYLVIDPADWLRNANTWWYFELTATNVAPGYSVEGSFLIEVIPPEVISPNTPVTDMLAKSGFRALLVTGTVADPAPYQFAHTQTSQQLPDIELGWIVVSGDRSIIEEYTNTFELLPTCGLPGSAVVLTLRGQSQQNYTANYWASPLLQLENSIIKTFRLSPKAMMQHSFVFPALQQQQYGRYLIIEITANNGDFYGMYPTIYMNLNSPAGNPTSTPYGAPGWNGASQLNPVKCTTLPCYAVIDPCLIPTTTAHVWYIAVESTDTQNSVQYNINATVATAQQFTVGTDGKPLRGFTLPPFGYAYVTVTGTTNVEALNYLVADLPDDLEDIYIAKKTGTSVGGVPAGYFTCGGSDINDDSSHVILADVCDLAIMGAQLTIVNNNPYSTDVGSLNFTMVNLSPQGQGGIALNQDSRGAFGLTVTNPATSQGYIEAYINATQTGTAGATITAYPVYANAGQGNVPLAQCGDLGARTSCTVKSSYDGCMLQIFSCALTHPNWMFLVQGNGQNMITAYAHNPVITLIPEAPGLLPGTFQFRYPNQIMPFLIPAIPENFTVEHHLSYPAIYIDGHDPTSLTWRQVAASFVQGSTQACLWTAGTFNMDPFSFQGYGDGATFYAEFTQGNGLFDTTKQYTVHAWFFNTLPKNLMYSPQFVGASQFDQFTFPVDPTTAWNKYFYFTTTVESTCHALNIYGARQTSAGPNCGAKGQIIDCTGISSGTTDCIMNRRDAAPGTLQIAIGSTGNMGTTPDGLVVYTPLASWNTISIVPIDGGQFVNWFGSQTFNFTQYRYTAGTTLSGGARLVVHANLGASYLSQVYSWSIIVSRNIPIPVSSNGFQLLTEQGQWTASCNGCGQLDLQIDSCQFQPGDYFIGFNLNFNGGGNPAYNADAPQVHFEAHMDAFDVIQLPTDGSVTGSVLDVNSRLSYRIDVPLTVTEALLTVVVEGVQSGTMVYLNPGAPASASCNMISCNSIGFCRLVVGPSTGTWASSKNGALCVPTLDLSNTTLAVGATPYFLTLNSDQVTNSAYARIRVFANATYVGLPLDTTICDSTRVEGNHYVIENVPTGVERIMVSLTPKAGVVSIYISSPGFNGPCADPVISGNPYELDIPYTGRTIISVYGSYNALEQSTFELRAYALAVNKIPLHLGVAYSGNLNPGSSVLFETSVEQASQFLTLQTTSAGNVNVELFTGADMVSIYNCDSAACTFSDSCGSVGRNPVLAVVVNTGKTSTSFTIQATARAILAPVAMTFSQQTFSIPAFDAPFQVSIPWNFVNASSMPILSIQTYGAALNFYLSVSDEATTGGAATWAGPGCSSTSILNVAPTKGAQITVQPCIVPAKYLLHDVTATLVLTATVASPMSQWEQDCDAATFSVTVASDPSQQYAVLPLNGKQITVSGSGVTPLTMVGDMSTALTALGGASAPSGAGPIAPPSGPKIVDDAVIVAFVQVQQTLGSAECESQATKFTVTMNVGSCGANSIVQTCELSSHPCVIAYRPCNVLDGINVDSITVRLSGGIVVAQVSMVLGSLSTISSARLNSQYSLIGFNPTKDKASALALSTTEQPSEYLVVPMSSSCTIEHIQWNTKQVWNPLFMESKNVRVVEFATATSNIQPRIVVVRSMFNTTSTNSNTLSHSELTKELSEAPKTIADEFCSDVVDYDFYSPAATNASAASANMYDFLVARFGCQDFQGDTCGSCRHRITQACADAIKNYACYANFRSSQKKSLFALPVCRSVCVDVELACSATFESLNLAGFTCGSTRYLNDMDGNSDVECTPYSNRSSSKHTGLIVGLTILAVVIVAGAVFAAIRISKAKAAGGAVSGTSAGSAPTAYSQLGAAQEPLLPAEGSGQV